jgi:hypothetical protein
LRRTGLYKLFVKFGVLIHIDLSENKFAASPS